MACNKMAFQSRAEANAFIRGEGIWSGHFVEQRRGNLTAYQCRHCGEWHTTSQSKKRGKSIRNREKRRDA